MGSAKAPFSGLDEIVSMKWSGVLGAGTPAKSMGAGRAKSPASDGTAKCSDGSGWVQCPGGAKAGGMQRERAAGSLAKIAV